MNAAMKQFIILSVSVAVLSACSSGAARLLKELEKKPDNAGNTNNTTVLTPAQLEEKKQEAARMRNGLYLGVADSMTEDIVDDHDHNKKIGTGTTKSLDITVNGKTYYGQAYPKTNVFFAPINPNDFKQGRTASPYESITKAENSMLNGQKFSAQMIQRGQIKMYNQPFAFVAGFYNTNLEYTENIGGKESKESVADDHRQTVYGGIPTATLPPNTTLRYTGEAFNKNGYGVLDYEIAYKANNTGVGKGKISGMSDYGDIILSESNIRERDHSFQDLNTGAIYKATLLGIDGTAQFADKTSGDYTLGIFGPGAAEIAGKVTTSKTYMDADKDTFKDEIGFAGRKQP